MTVVEGAGRVCLPLQGERRGLLGRHGVAQLPGCGQEASVGHHLLPNVP